MAETLPFTLHPPEEGKVRLLATPEPRFCNLTNTVHGGWIMTMLDTAMALAAQTILSLAKPVRHTKPPPNLSARYPSIPA
jgi:thioredoxin reductase (NADPH)